MPEARALEIQENVALLQEYSLHDPFPSLCFFNKKKSKGNSFKEFFFTKKGVKWERKKEITKDITFSFSA